MKRKIKLIISLYVAFLSVGLCSLAQAAPGIGYTVSMDEPHTHYFDVQMKVSGYKQPYIDFKMPVWTPGSYLVREYAKNVEALLPATPKEAL
jgi:hypothetical protein